MLQRDVRRRQRGRPLLRLWGASDTPAPHGAGSPAYEPYDDGVLEVAEVVPVPEVADESAPAQGETADES